MKRADILFLTQIVPYPPDSGPKVKTYHVIRYLAQQGHRVTLATFARSHEEQHLPALRPLCASVHTVPMHRSRPADAAALLRSLGTGLPFLVQRDAAAEMYGLVRRLASEQRFDIVHAESVDDGPVRRQRRRRPLRL